MQNPRPDSSSLIDQDTSVVPMSCQRVIRKASKGERVWIGPDEASQLSEDEQKAYDLALQITAHLAVRAPRARKSGHPGGSLSAFTPCFILESMRDPGVDQPLRMSPGHLSVLGYSLQWLFGREGTDERLTSPQSIIDTFRTPSGLPGHIEAGIGNIPFGSGPLGKMVSHGVGTAFGLKLQGKDGMVDVLLADGDSQEGQVQEAFRLATELELGNLIVHGDWNDIQLSGLPTETVAADFAEIAHATGWNVIEVQNGNSPAECKAAIEKAKTFSNNRPTFICYYTTMGYGIPLMEEGSNTGKKNYHGAPLSDEEAEEALKGLRDLDECIHEYEGYRSREKERFESAKRVETDIELEPNFSGYTREIMEEKGAARKEFGATHLLNMMKIDSRIYVLHADLAGSGGFNAVEKEFPDRVINVGVAEANMYMMAAGMRQTGLIPVTYTFAAFGTNEARANARLIDINCSHTRAGIINDCTHSGLSVGEDGETHQEQNYLNIPLHHTQVWMPADSNQCAAMAEESIRIVCEGHQSVYVFSARSGHEQVKTRDGDLFYGASYEFDGTIDMVRGNGDVTDQITIIATGIAVHDAIEAADELAKADQPLNVRVLNVSCIQPIDSGEILKAALETRHIIVVEDHNAYGGLATQVSDVLSDFSVPCSLRRLGLNHYFPSASANDLKLIAGLDSESIVDAVEDEVRSEVFGGEDGLVSVLFALPDNLSTSKHAAKAHDYTQLLATNSDYVKNLRDFWKESDASELPSTQDLQEKILG